MSDGLEVLQGKWAKFRGMTWPIPDDELSRTLRYGEPTRQELLRAASELDAYAELVACPVRKRQLIISYLRDALRAPPHA